MTQSCTALLGGWTGRCGDQLQCDVAAASCQEHTQLLRNCLMRVRHYRGTFNRWFGSYRSLRTNGFCLCSNCLRSGGFLLVSPPSVLAWLSWSLLLVDPFQTDSTKTILDCFVHLDAELQPTARCSLGLKDCLSLDLCFRLWALLAPSQLRQSPTYSALQVHMYVLFQLQTVFPCQYAMCETLFLHTTINKGFIGMQLLSIK